MAVIRNCDRRRRAVSVPRLAQAAAIASQTGLPGPRALVQESPQGSAGESLGLVGPLMALLAGPHCQSLAIRGLTVPGPMVVLMAKAARVLAALKRDGWTETRRSGSHRVLVRGDQQRVWLTMTA